MTKYTYDTSFIIANRALDLPENFFFSSVVLLELMSNAKDESERKKYQSVWREYEKDKTLIVPNNEDWLMASKVLFWLTQKRKKKSGGKLPPQQTGASQRMVLDTLLALSVRRVGVTIITDNWDEFTAMQYYISNLKLKKGNEFLREQ